MIKIRERVNKGEEFYFINVYGVVDKGIDRHDVNDDIMYNFGNYFPTIEEAERAVKAVKNSLDKSFVDPETYLINRLDKIDELGLDGYYILIKEDSTDYYIVIVDDSIYRNNKYIDLQYDTTSAIRKLSLNINVVFMNDVRVYDDMLINFKDKCFDSDARIVTHKKFTNKI